MLEDTYQVFTQENQYGIVGVTSGNLSCLVCKNCRHVQCFEATLRDVDVSDGDQFDMLKIFQKMSQCTGHTENPYSLKLWSHKRIPFVVPFSSRETLINKVSNTFVIENGIAQAIPTESHCAVCGTALSQDCYPVSTMSWILTRYTLSKAQGIYIQQ